MRLLNTKTVQLEEFNEADCPRYAILSHTWGNGEVTFQELQQEKTPAQKAGYEKIVKTCREALARGLNYAWVDTCCIDKSSSAELSEVINSMFRWYAKAEVCFAYLSDIRTGASFRKLVESRWFTRGWTLQELIAPPMLLFFDNNWQLIGNRSAFRFLIASSTGIGADFLRDDMTDIHHRLGFASVAQRMSWAAKRNTTRVEDLAYCLLGIFDINMPLLYGEGNR